VIGGIPWRKRPSYRTGSALSCSEGFVPAVVPVVEVVLAVARRLRGSWVRMATAWCPGCWWWRSWRCRLRTKRSSGWGPGRCL